MKARRVGFTLIEVAMVLPLTMVLAYVMFQLHQVFAAELQTAALQADVKQEMRRAAALIYRQAAQGWSIAPDNRSLRFGQGASLRWEGDRLLLGSRSLLTRPVRLFLATADEGSLVLTLEVEAPLRWRGEPQRQRMVFLGGPR